MSDASTPGREPVQLLEIKQPLCGNVYGVSPCTAAAGVGLECYNTRATCQDVPNYRHNPEFLLTANVIASDGDTVTNGEILRSDDLFAAVDVYIPTSPDGVIWEQGDSTIGSYLGFTSGLLTWRTGDSTSLGGTNSTSKISVDASAFEGKEVTIFVEYVDSTSIVNMWIWDEINRVVTLMGTDAPVSTYADWTSTADGGVGTVIGTSPIGESTTDYNGDIHELRIYNNLNAPNMTNPFLLPLFFSAGHVADQKVNGVDHITASLVSVGTVPTRMNLSTSNSDATGLGNRAVMTSRFSDHPTTDRIVDPYVNTRLFDPFEQGSYWSKWLVRNEFRFNTLGVVHEGYVGQPLSEMLSRSYIMTASEGPNGNGDVTLQWKDILAKLEERKAQAPIASNGILVSDVTVGALSLEVQGASSTEYEASGTIRINDELMTYSGFTELDGVFTFTITARASDGTAAEAHSAEDTVQSCLRITNLTADAIVTLLAVEWAGMPRGYLDTFGTFKSETDDFLAAYILSAVISEPTGVSTLLAELQTQVGFNLWWHERDKLVKMKAVRGVLSEPDLLTDAANIVGGSFSLKDEPKRRISQLWFSYGLHDPTLPLESISSFKQTLIQADLPSEGASQYGEQSIRRIFSRWVDSAALALSTASKIITRYAKTPKTCGFSLDAKDGRIYWVGDVVRISHPRLVDEFGARKISIWTITSAEEKVAGETITYAAEDTTLYGKITVIQANGSPDYQGDGSDPFAAGFIGDNDGLLSDGTVSARIN